MSKKKTRARRTPPRPRSQKSTRSRPPTPPPRNTAIITWVLGWPRHVKQGVAAVVLLVFTIILAVGLLTRHAHNLLATLGNAFYALFGVGTYLLVIGLIALAIANLAEAATQTKIIRLGLVIQLPILGLLLVLESRLIFGGNAGQLTGALLARPLAGLPALAQQAIVVGAIAIVLLLVFRISWRQMRLVLRWSFSALGRVFGALGQKGRALFGGLAQAGGAAQTRSAASHLPAAIESKDDEALQPDANATAPAELDALPSLAPLPRKAGTTASAAPGREVEGTPGPASGSLAIARETRTGRAALPVMSLLNGAVEQRKLNQEKMIEDLARRVERTLRSFRVEAEVRRADISIGPTVIRIGIRPLEGVKKDYRGHVVRDEAGEPIIMRTKVSRILALQNDLALDLEAKSIRLEAPVPGRPYVGVEIPNKQGRLVTLREILASKDYEESLRKSKLTIALGRDVVGQARVGDLARFPHLLIAGATGSGKSVCLSSIIACMLMQATPEDVRFLMVDPKMVELTIFNGIPHLLAPVVTEGDKVAGMLKLSISEMERRYRRFSKLGVRNLDAYRKLCAQRPELEVLPSIVIVIDELADLMMAAPEEIESLICRLAQLARATGIHLVVATQRPSVDVITGLIKANFPTRISFMVSSAVDSRTILDMGGAERLLGRGDMLYLPADVGKPERIQGTFLGDDELERIVNHWRLAPRPSSTESSWEQGPDDAGNQAPVPPSV